MQNRIFYYTAEAEWRIPHYTKNITVKDTVVSNGSGRAYYHKSCAEKLHIV